VAQVSYERKRRREASQRTHRRGSPKLNDEAKQKTSFPRDIWAPTAAESIFRRDLALRRVYDRELLKAGLIAWRTWNVKTTLSPKPAGTPIKNNRAGARSVGRWFDGKVDTTFCQGWLPTSASSKSRRPRPLKKIWRARSAAKMLGGQASVAHRYGGAVSYGSVARSIGGRCIVAAPCRIRRKESEDGKRTFRATANRAPYEKRRRFHLIDPTQ